MIAMAGYFWIQRNAQGNEVRRGKVIADDGTFVLLGVFSPEVSESILYYVLHPRAELMGFPAKGIEYYPSTHGVSPILPRQPRPARPAPGAPLAMPGNPPSPPPATRPSYATSPSLPAEVIESRLGYPDTYFCRAFTVEGAKDICEAMNNLMYQRARGEL